MLAPELPDRSTAHRVRRLQDRSLSIRLRLALHLVDRASVALLTSQEQARELTRAALAVALPTDRDEKRPETRHLLPIAVDVAASAYTVEAEAWLLEGQIERAEVPASLARLLALEGSGDPLVFGAVEAMLGLRAWLRGSLGRSLRHQEQAIVHFAEAGDPAREADAWGRTAVVLEQAGLIPEAREARVRARQLGRQDRELVRHRESKSRLAELLADSPALHQEATRAVNPHLEHGI